MVRCSDPAAVRLALPHGRRLRALRPHNLPLGARAHQEAEPGQPGPRPRPVAHHPPGHQIDDRAAAGAHEARATNLYRPAGQLRGQLLGQPVQVRAAAGPGPQPSERVHQLPEPGADAAALGGRGGDISPAVHEQG